LYCPQLCPIGGDVFDTLELANEVHRMGVNENEPSRSMICLGYQMTKRIDEMVKRMVFMYIIYIGAHK
jgi:hypothetical protein